MLHDMCKRVLYVYANSNAMVTTRDYTPYWVGALGAVDALLIGGIVAGALYNKRSKQRELEAAEAGGAAEAVATAEAGATESDDTKE